MIKYVAVLYLFCLTQISIGQSVGDQIPEGFDHQQENIAHGKVDTIAYHSETVGTTRRAVIYTPPGFSAENKYPVLYLLHGIGGDEFEWLQQGNPQVILDNLYASQKITPMIVVLPNGRAMIDDRATGDIFDSAKVQAFATFEQDLLSDLIPYIEDNYLVHDQPFYRALAGLSMGGGQSLNFGLSNPDKFGWVGGFSSAPNTRSPEAIMPEPQTAIGKFELIYLSCGEDDDLMPISRNMHDYLEENAVPHVFEEMSGAHDFEVWKKSLYRFSSLIFK